MTIDNYKFDPFLFIKFGMNDDVDFHMLNLCDAKTFDNCNFDPFVIIKFGMNDDVDFICRLTLCIEHI